MANTQRNRQKKIRCPTIKSSILVAEELQGVLSLAEDDDFDLKTLREEEEEEEEKPTSKLK